MTGLEITASVCGFVAVWLTITRNIWCWPIGLAQVLLYIFVFYYQKFYSDCILHVIYVFLQIYGWYSWSHPSAGQATENGIVVERLSGASFCLSMTLVVLGTAAWGYLMAHFTDAVVPYGDAFTTVASLLAQVLLARKKIENWVFWVAVDVVAIGLYGYRGLYPTMVLYTLFLGMAIMGWLVWRRRWQQQVTELMLKV